MGKKFAKLSDTAKSILDYVKEKGEGITFAEVKEAIPGANPSHLGALVKRGLVDAEITEVNETVVVKKKVNKYTFINDDQAQTDEPAE